MRTGAFAARMGQGKNKNSASRLARLVFFLPIPACWDHPFPSLKSVVSFPPTAQRPFVAQSLTSEIKCVFFILMQATLTELRRETSRILGPVIHASQKVLITEHGRKIAAIVPIAEPDRKRALQMLTAIGPVEMPNRR